MLVDDAMVPSVVLSVRRKEMPINGVTIVVRLLHAIRMNAF